MKKTAKRKTLHQRWRSHLYKAFVLKEVWELPATIRKYGEDNFSMEIIDIVRGKKDAFALESILINTLGTELNTRRITKEY